MISIFPLYPRTPVQLPRLHYVNSTKLSSQLSNLHSCSTFHIVYKVKTLSCNTVIYFIPHHEVTFQFSQPFLTYYIHIYYFIWKKYVLCIPIFCIYCKMFISIRKEKNKLLLKSTFIYWFCHRGETSRCNMGTPPPCQNLTRFLQVIFSK